MFYRKINLTDLFSEFDSFFNDSGFTSFNKDGRMKRKTYTSDDGYYQITTFYTVPFSSENDTKEDDLNLQLNNAVKEQNYELAAELRDKIKLQEENKDKINDLESKLEKAVSEQDFENAIKFRDKLKKLKS